MSNKEEDETSDEDSETDLTEEEEAVLNEVVNAGEKGVTSEDIAKKLGMPIEKVEQILNDFEESGWFYSEEEDE